MHGERTRTDAKHLHIILHLWGSWWQSSHGLRTVRSQISWWVWYEPLGKEEGGGGRRRRRAFLVSSQADRQRPVPHLSRQGNAVCSQQGVLWLAHLVSAGEEGTGRPEMEKMRLGKRSWRFLWLVCLVWDRLGGERGGYVNVSFYVLAAKSLKQP